MLIVRGVIKKMAKIIEALKFNNKISLKSRLLLGVFLIIYLFYIVNQYQSSIELGDKLLHEGIKINEYSYLIGYDEYTTRDKAVDVLQKTSVLFILPILIFLLKNRKLVYIFTLLTIFLSIYINFSVIIPFILFFLAPLIIVIFIILIWESKKNDVDTNVTGQLK